MNKGWTKEATRAANFLAALPSGSATLEHSDLRALLLETGGNIFARGRLYNIKTQHLGAGIHRVTLELTHP